METNFQKNFSVNIWCSIIGSQITGTFVHEERLTSDPCLRFLEDDLPLLLGDVPYHIK